MKIIKDYLPHPSELAVKDDDLKVMLSLSRSYIAFFTRESKWQLVPYQKMLRALVDSYAVQVGG